MRARYDEDRGEKVYLERKGSPTVSEANRDDTGIVLGLEARKKWYEGFFETLGPAASDVQGTYAYTAVAKAIADVHKKTDPKPGLYAMTPVVMGERDELKPQ